MPGSRPRPSAPANRATSHSTVSPAMIRPTKASILRRRPSAAANTGSRAGFRRASAAASLIGGFITPLNAPTRPKLASCPLLRLVFRELLLVDLALRGPGELVDELDLAGHLVLGEVVLDMRLEVVLRDLA